MSEITNTPNEGELVVVSVTTVNQTVAMSNSMNLKVLKVSFSLARLPVDGSRIFESMFVKGNA